MRDFWFDMVTESMHPFRARSGAATVVVATMNIGYFIRIARPADFEAVGAVLLASYSRLLAAHYDRVVLDVALPFMTSANAILLASGSYYVAESGTGALVGCGGWSMAPPGGGEIAPGEGHIRHFAVHPDWLGQKIGTSLLARCFDDASPGIRRLYCYSSLNAEPFYRSCGFETIGPIDLPMGQILKFPSVLMKREQS